MIPRSYCISLFFAAMFGGLVNGLPLRRIAPHISTRFFSSLFNLQYARAFHPLRYTSPIRSQRVQAATQRALVTSRAEKRPFHLLIVESPSKCDTISKILQQYVQENNLPHDYVVKSCMGHIRNLPKKKTDEAKLSKSENSSFPYEIRGIDLNDQYRPTYVIIPGKQTIVKELKSTAKKAEKVLLATDPDREGEAMAWHLAQVLEDDASFQRVSFTEITPAAILHAVQNPTIINPNLVEAQETRRILDRLAGYTVSPVLWRKIAPGLSAGRVQSVGLWLIVQRERERLVFESTTYSSIQGYFKTPGGNLTATLYSVNGTVIASSGKDFTSQGKTLTTESQHKVHLLPNEAERLTSILWHDRWTVVDVKSRVKRQQSPMPYKTSTLQQDAVKNLGLPLQQTMQCAQQLYENGLITYMRTDSVHLSDDAEKAIVKDISFHFGSHNVLVPENSPKRKTKSDKFAQEAHEAIRPAIQNNGMFRQPEHIASSSLSEAATKLYKMIYQRTLASRMPPCVINHTTAIIEGRSGETVLTFRASGSVVVSRGYTEVFGYLDDDDGETTQHLPKVDKGQIVELTRMVPQEHHSQAPPRYTESSFVKLLESLGVGRPSTYAGIVQTLRDRAYVGSPSERASPRYGRAISGPAISAIRAAGGEAFVGNSKGGARAALVPSLSAFVVCALLEKYCPSYVDPSFTAQMEEKLDEIAAADDVSFTSGIGVAYSSVGGKRVQYLDEFYAGDNGLAARVKRMDEIVAAEEARQAILPALTDRLHGNHSGRKLGIFVGPWGPYVQLRSTSGGANDKPLSIPLPSSLASDLSAITPSIVDSLLATKEKGGIFIGTHPTDGRNIRLKTGRFGAYLQWGDDGDEKATTHSLPKHQASLKCIKSEEVSDSEDLCKMLGLTLSDAVGYVGLPRIVCHIDNDPVTAGIGPYGPYLKYKTRYATIKEEEDGSILSINRDTALRIVEEKILSSTKRRRGVIAEIGEKDGSPLLVKKNRLGKYLSWNGLNVPIPAGFAENLDDIPLDAAWKLILEKKLSMPLTSRASPRRKLVKDDRNVGRFGTLPPPPKRPLTAYLHFCAAKRQDVSQDAKGLGDISRILADLWAGTSEKDREIYYKMAESSKEVYEREKRKWEKQSERDKSESTEEIHAKAVRPKRPVNAYQFFCAQHRQEVSKQVKSIGDISKELARLWAATTIRTEYEDLAAKDKKRYEEEMASIHNHGSTAAAESDSIAKKTRAPSAYMLFCKEMRPQMLDEHGRKLPFGEAAKRLATLWKECDPETKQKFLRLGELRISSQS